MQADQGVAHIFLQRHVAHHAHRAKTLGGVQCNLVHRLGRKHACNGFERQIGQAAIGVDVRMVRCPRHLADRVARDFEPDRNVRE